MTHPVPTSGDGSAARRFEGDDGAGLVMAITLMFSFTFLSLVFLARDVDRTISNESAAQSIAFQSARTAAQQASIGSARSGELALDSAEAEAAGRSVAARLFQDYGVDGSVTAFRVDGLEVTVVVTLSDGNRRVSGTGVVTATRAP